MRIPQFNEVRNQPHQPLQKRCDNFSLVPLSSMLGDRFALSDLEGKAVNIDTELTSASIRDASILKKLG